ncbi:hypothetical protein [Actinomadura sp. 9N407]|uniref:hypothetical protein n=1 Tax=Actinomadura sp. 9N407 TaxID=3375154 RepID=UPI0037B4EC9B
MLIAASMDVGYAYRARFGSGTAGTFTALEHHCGGRECTWSGDFVSDDGGRTRRDVRLIGAGPEDPGDRVAAVDSGHRHSVYIRSGSWDWLLITILSIISIAFLVVWAFSLILAVSRRRR